MNHMISRHQISRQYPAEGRPGSGRQPGWQPLNGRRIIHLADAGGAPPGSTCRGTPARSTSQSRPDPGLDIAVTRQN